jgi:hypothetical protein
MRTVSLLLGIAALVGLTGAERACASSRGAPGHRRLVAEDGRAYLLVNVRAKSTPAYGRAEFVLVRRREGAPPATAETAAWDAPPLAPLPGDEVLARREGVLPVEARCLEDAAGWLSVDEWPRPGFGRVLERRDARGALVWERSLADLFTASEIGAFPELGPEYRAWLQAFWLDAAAGDAVLLATGARLRRVALVDGTRRPRVDVAGTLLAQVAAPGDGGAQGQRAALLAAESLALEGLLDAVARGFEDGATSYPVRALLAERLLRERDHAGALELFLAALAPSEPEGTRAWAAAALGAVLPRRGAEFRAAARARLEALGSEEAKRLAEDLG